MIRDKGKHCKTIRDEMGTKKMIKDERMMKR
jgi:hypothetical protein